MSNAPGQGRKPKASTIVEKLRTRAPRRQPGRLPHAPSYLDDNGKAEWRRTGKLLLQAGLMDELDTTALATYCQAYSRWLAAEEQIKENGMIVAAKNGFPVQSPYLAISNKAAQQMAKFMSEFGMTPASRSRLPAKVKEDKPKQQLSKPLDFDPRALLGANN